MCVLVPCVMELGETEDAFFFIFLVETIRTARLFGALTKHVPYIFSGLPGEEGWRERGNVTDVFLTAGKRCPVRKGKGGGGDTYRFRHLVMMVET